MRKLERLNSLWVGERLGYIEQLSIASALAVGHSYTLYSYTPEKLRDVPQKAEVRDACEIMSDKTLTRFFDIGWNALGSDFFRYTLLAKQNGYWVDLDLEFLKPLDFDDPYVFGWERLGSINGAVMRLPRHCAMLTEISAPPKKNWKPPFYGLKRTALFYWARLTSGDLYPEHLPWGAYGPELITFLAKKHAVACRAQPWKVFYPVQYHEAHLFSGPQKNVEEKLTEETRTVHFWHSHLAAEVKLTPPPGSYLEGAARRYGVHRNT